MLFSPYYAKNYAGIIDKGLLGGPTTHSTLLPPAHPLYRLNL